MSEAASIVVGGGLAGSAFAITLARQGRPVSFWKRPPVPITKCAANS